MPFVPVHLLFINLLTDSLPAIAIGMEPAEDGLLSQKPRDPKEGILTRRFSFLLFAQGALIAAAVIGAFFIGLRTDAATASTLAFATLTLARLFHGFNCRGEKSIFRLGLFSNSASVGAFVLGVLLLSLVLFVPALHGLFSVSVLSAWQILCLLGLAAAPTVVIQLVKVLTGSKNKAK